MIPKVIHYCWFGRNPKPEIVKKCIESWKQYCPDYEIIEWNEDNFDVDFCQYSSDAYEAQKWAFVSDIARIKIIYDNGGIYLDTDVELKQSLNDLLGYDAWFAQDDIRYINTGLGFGACKNNFLVGKILSERKMRAFDLVICNAIDTPIIRGHLNCKQSRESQCIDNIMILGMLDYPKYGRHYEGNSWKSEEEKAFANQRRNKLWRVKCFFETHQLLIFLKEMVQQKYQKHMFYFRMICLIMELYIL